MPSPSRIDRALADRVSRLDRLVVLQLPGPGWTTRVHLRAVVVTAVLSLAAFAVFAWSLGVGDVSVPIGDVLASLIGRGTGDGDFVVQKLRLPRGLTALLVGAAWGLSGAIFQRLARNPLASPDIIGVNAGAALAAVVVIVLFNGTSAEVTAGALAGSAITSIAIYALAYKRGVSGYRLVLVGIGVTAVLGSGTSYLLTHAELFDAQRATVWLTGSLNGRGWEHVRPVGAALVLLIPLAVALAPQLRVLELGDDAAKGLGANVERSRGALLLAATALAAVATASAGPVGFVALVSPQIARRLVGGRSLGLLPAAATGALLLVASDLVGRRIFAPTQLPVGIITALIGGPYLLYLLSRANRIGSAG